MTVEEAIARFLARWAHPPIERADVEERVAMRMIDGDPETVAIVIETAPACRIFVQRTEAGPWRSAYVHAIADVDAIVDSLLRPISVSRRKRRSSKAA